MSSTPLGKFEHNLVSYVSEHQGLTVREIYEDFGQKQGYVRGTIVKAMDRLHRKGAVVRESVDGTYKYKSAVNPKEVELSVVDRFVHDRLGGSLQPIAEYLATARNLDPAEIRKLRDALERVGA